MFVHDNTSYNFCVVLAKHASHFYPEPTEFIYVYTKRKTIHGKMIQVKFCRLLRLIWGAHYLHKFENEK